MEPVSSKVAFSKIKIFRFNKFKVSKYSVNPLDRAPRAPIKIVITADFFFHKCSTSTSVQQMIIVVISIFGANLYKMKRGEDICNCKQQEKVLKPIIDTN